MTRKLTEHKLGVCDKIFITSDSTEWDPYSDHFAANEVVMLNCERNLIDPNDCHPSIKTPLVESHLSFPLIHVVNALIDEVIANRIDNRELILHYQFIKITDLSQTTKKMTLQINC